MGIHWAFITTHPVPITCTPWHQWMGVRNPLRTYTLYGTTPTTPLCALYGGARGAAESFAPRSSYTELYNAPTVTLCALYWGRCVRKCRDSCTKLIKHTTHPLCNTVTLFARYIQSHLHQGHQTSIELEEARVRCHWPPTPHRLNPHFLSCVVVSVPARVLP